MLRFGIWTKEGNTMNNKVLHIAKVLVKSYKEDKFIGFTCPTEKEVKAKNNNFNELSDALKQMNVSVLTINFDSAYLKNADLDLSGEFDGISYNIKKAENINDYDIVLINMLPIVGNEQLLIDNDIINCVILNAVYGDTSYKNFEKTMDALKESGMKTAGIISNKHRINRK